MKNLIFIFLVFFAFSCNHNKNDKCERFYGINHPVIWEDLLLDTTGNQGYHPYFPMFIYNNSLIYPKKTNIYNNTKIVKRDLNNIDEYEEIVAEGLWEDFVIHDGRVFYIFNHTLKSVDLESMKSEDNLNLEKSTTLLNGLDDKIYLSVLDNYGADTLLKQEIQSYDINTKEVKTVFSKIYSIADYSVGTYKWYLKMEIPTIWKTKDDDRILTYFDTYKRYVPDTGTVEQIKLVSANLENQQELFKKSIDVSGLRGLRVEAGHIVVTINKGFLSRTLYVYNGLTGSEKWSKSGILCHMNPENKSLLVSGYFNLFEYSIYNGETLSKGELPAYKKERYFNIKDDDIFYLTTSITVERLTSGCNHSQNIFKFISADKNEDLASSLAYDKNNSLLYLRSNKKIFAIDLK